MARIVGPVAIVVVGGNDLHADSPRTDHIRLSSGAPPWLGQEELDPLMWSPHLLSDADSKAVGVIEVPRSICGQ